MRIRSWIVTLAAAVGLMAQSQFRPGVKPFIAVDTPVIALEHVRILDGTGAPPRENQTIVIAGGRIGVIGPADEVQVPAGAHRMALPDQTVIPGLVGMHEHLFYPSGGRRADLHRAWNELPTALPGVRSHYSPYGGDARALHGFEPEKNDRPRAHAWSQDAHYRWVLGRAWPLCAADGGAGYSGRREANWKPLSLALTRAA